LAIQIVAAVHRLDRRAIAYHNSNKRISQISRRTASLALMQKETLAKRAGN